MKNKTTRFLIFSIVALVVISACVFFGLQFIMRGKSTAVINEVGTLYMSGISEQISRHFETLIGLRLEQVESIAAQTSPTAVTYGKAMIEELTTSGRLRDLDELALYSEAGVFEMLYGDSVVLDDPEPFLNSIQAGERKVAIGHTDSDETVILLGIPAAYPMKSGNDSIALVAGIPTDYINGVLSLDTNSDRMYSHIIREDGSYVIKNTDSQEEDYFSHLRNEFDAVDGRTVEECIKELQTAIAEGRDYSSVLMLANENRHIYCTKLSDSEWYLVSVMPYGELDATVGELDAQRTVLFVGCFGIVLILLLSIFSVYFNMTKKQLKEINETREEAIYANKAKSEFLSNMSHDIRTPMNVIIGMTAVASSSLDDRQKVEDCLNKITLSSKHLLGLINDVLDMSKIESGKLTLNMHQVSLREIMDSVVNIVQPQVKAKNQNFDIFIQDIMAEAVYCDSIRLNQVLLNFLSNAIKFTPEGGTIHVSLLEEESPVSRNHVRIHLRVKDDGIGMTPEFQENIFDSFTRENSSVVQRTEGTGLGMTITKYIIDALGGTIELNSAPGEGTEFHVTLDLERAVLREEDMRLPDWNLLMVDDHKELCLSAVAALKETGVNAEWALDGRTALQMVEERHRKQEDYHIILLDWKMPDMDGRELAREIRKWVGEEVPILLVSAYDWSEIEEEARAAGINGFIPKPLFKSTLFHGLRPYAEGGNPVEEPEEETGYQLGGARILLAEDNDMNWEIAYDLLAACGLELERAENGQVCVEKFKQSEAGFYDAILMDIRMPVMTGYDAAKHIRRMDHPDADIPIIAMTADVFPEDIQRSLDCGMNAHIAKPIDIKEVLCVLEQYINK
ncbi:MAG: response regulator [Bacteroides sp.]|nr:response regulator [Bacteroides sp.]MCM1550453.1 response regulator [Clostridium sp.]